MLDKLFHKKPVTALSDINTKPLEGEKVRRRSSKKVSFYPPQLVCGSAQSVGKQREQNEDALIMIHSVVADGNEVLPIGVFIIADGMGGHQHGEIASGAASRVMAEHLVSRVYLPTLDPHGSLPSDSIQEIMEDGVRLAQQTVLKNAPGGGTTLTAALVLGEQVNLAHVGDSRAYFILSDDNMEVITQDHSLVRRLQELGQISESEASVHPQRNVLYRAIGQTEPFRPDINTIPFPAGARLLLCSDGLWGVVKPPDIIRIVKAASSPAIACHELVKAANAAGGPDNISVILVELAR